MTSDVDDPNDPNDPRGINIRGVKAALEDVFKGCLVEIRQGGASYHAEVRFDEYDVRVILSGRRGVDRPMHLRFRQIIAQEHPRKPMKRIIMDVATTDEAELHRSIKEIKAYLLGIVQSINHALKPKHQREIDGVDALLQ